MQGQLKITSLATLIPYFRGFKQSDNQKIINIGYENR